MFSSLLPQTVEVYARSGQVDRFGQPVDSNPRQNKLGRLIGSYPCRVYAKSGGLVNQERSLDVFERVWAMLTELSADIQENDAVRVIAPGGAIEVNLAVIKDSGVIYTGDKAHHKEFTLLEQSGPNPERPAP